MKLIETESLESDEIEINPILFDMENNFQQRDTMFGKTQNSMMIRKSVVFEDPDKSYENKKRLIKSIIQKLRPGDVIQELNDLIDSLVIMFSKGMDDSIVAPLDDLRNLCSNSKSLYEAYDCRELKNQVENAIESFRNRDEEALAKAVLSIEKVPVLI